MINISKEGQSTIYTIKNKGKFRVVRVMQVKDYEFIIQGQFEEVKTKGMLWWKKTSSIKEWKRIDKDGVRLWYFNILNNVDRFETYKTLEEAIKWIEDYDKYPICH